MSTCNELNVMTRSCLFLYMSRFVHNYLTSYDITGILIGIIALCSRHFLTSLVAEFLQTFVVIFVLNGSAHWRKLPHLETLQMRGNKYIQTLCIYCQLAWIIGPNAVQLNPSIMILGYKKSNLKPIVEISENNQSHY